MPRTGRPPTPSVLRLLKPKSHHKQNHAEPKPERGKPTAPEWLPDDALRLFGELSERLDAMKVLTTADGAALVMLCMAWDEYLEAAEEVAEAGISYEAETDNGMIVRAHPSVKTRADAWRRFVGLLRDFGLTPGGRSALKIIPEPKPDQDALDELLFGERRG